MSDENVIKYTKIGLASLCFMGVIIGDIFITTFMFIASIFTAICCSISLLEDLTNPSLPDDWKAHNIKVSLFYLLLVLIHVGITAFIALSL